MHHASVCENVAIGVLVVLCELHVVVRVHVIPLVVHAVVGLTLGLIAHVVVVVFVVAILHRIFCLWRYTLYTEHVAVMLCFFATEFSVVIAFCQFCSACSKMI